jgi:hypothetical protein
MGRLLAAIVALQAGGLACVTVQEETRIEENVVATRAERQVVPGSNHYWTSGRVVGLELWIRAERVEVCVDRTLEQVRRSRVVHKTGEGWIPDITFGALGVAAIATGIYTAADGRHLSAMVNAQTSTPTSSPAVFQGIGGGLIAAGAALFVPLIVDLFRVRDVVVPLDEKERIQQAQERECRETPVSRELTRLVIAGKPRPASGAAPTGELVFSFQDVPPEELPRAPTDAHLILEGQPTPLIWTQGTVDALRRAWRR